MKHLLPNDMNTQIAYTGRKLNSCFNIKDLPKFEHQYDIVYLGNCPDPNCNGNCNHLQLPLQSFAITIAIIGII